MLSRDRYGAETSCRDSTLLYSVCTDTKLLPNTEAFANILRDTMFSKLSYSYFYREYGRLVGLSSSTVRYRMIRCNLFRPASGFIHFYCICSSSGMYLPTKKKSKRIEVDIAIYVPTPFMDFSRRVCSTLFEMIIDEMSDELGNLVYVFENLEIKWEKEASTDYTYLSPYDDRVAVPWDMDIYVYEEYGKGKVRTPKHTYRYTDTLWLRYDEWARMVNW